MKGGFSYNIEFFFLNHFKNESLNGCLNIKNAEISIFPYQPELIVWLFYKAGTAIRNNLSEVILLFLISGHNIKLKRKPNWQP